MPVQNKKSSASSPSRTTDLVGQIFPPQRVQRKINVVPTVFYQQNVYVNVIHKVAPLELRRGRHGPPRTNLKLYPW